MQLADTRSRLAHERAGIEQLDPPSGDESGGFTRRAEGCTWALTARGPRAETSGMKRRPLLLRWRRHLPTCAALHALLLAPVAARAGDAVSEALSLVGADEKVVAASKRPQPVSETPSL